MQKKSMFVRFIGEIDKYFKCKYPFVARLEIPINEALPKSSSFYLGISPVFNKHVIINFMHMNKPWRVGQFTIYVHISSEYVTTENWDARDEQFESFEDGLYSVPSVALGIDKYWCLLPTTVEEDRYTTYWMPASYDNDEAVIKECIVDVCGLLDEHIFKKAGYIPGV